MWKFKLAIRHLSSAKLRTILTILGVIIGSALIVATSIGGESAREWLASRAFGEEARAIVLSLGELYEGGGYSLRPRPIFDRSIVSVLESLHGVDKVYPTGFAYYVKVKRGEGEMLVSSGVSFSDLGLLEELGVRFVDRTDGWRYGVMLSNKIAQRLGVGVGEDIIVEVPSLAINRSYTLIGIFEAPRSLLGRVLINDVYLPLKDWEGKYTQIYIIVKDIRDLDEVERSAVRVARENAGVTIADTEIISVSLRTLSESMLRAVNTIISYIFFTGILSLAIGGIGVANVMLMSLKERIREVAILKAIGASDRTLFNLYLIESSLIGAVGGLFGMAVGFAISFAASEYLLRIPLSFSIGSLLLGPLVGLVAGMLFGIYPALKAYKMSPGEALRWEW